MDERHWTVGELARKAGVTVRTLHQWDELGLLVPADRTGACYRLYDAEGVERLYRILALRRLGLGLDAVAAALDDDGHDLRAVVAQQLDAVDRRLELERRLSARLVRVLDALDHASRPSSDDLFETIEVMTMHERYYTDEQLAELARRSEELGDEGMERAQRDWAELIAAMDAARERGADPADPEVQRLAARWRDLIQAFTGGDPGITASLKRMYEEEGVEAASRGTMTRELQEYVGRAMVDSRGLRPLPRRRRT
jgi:MerR family transcriptional regulator, thiopeptide resistance regulator